MIFRETGPHIIPLPTRNETDLKKLKNQLASGQDLQVLVHPFFNEGSVYTGYLNQQYYRQSRDDFIRECLRNNSPLVLFEQIMDYKTLGSHIRHLGPGTLYAWPTPFANPVPLDADIHNRLKKEQTLLLYELPQHRETACWDMFGELLHQLMVQGLDVGGQCLFFFKEEDLTKSSLRNLAKQLKIPGNGKIATKDKQNAALIPGNCVGTLAGELAVRGFDINLTPPSWPNDLWSNKYLYLN